MNKTQLTEFLDILNTPYSDLAIWQDHKEIYRHSSGFIDEAKSIRPNGNELFWLYSSSKVMTCTAVMQLIEQGKISPDDLVKKYLPEYGELKFNQNGVVVPCEKQLTIRHLFSMCGGLDYDPNAPAIRELRQTSGNTASTREMVAQFTKKPLMFQPGEHFNYSLCHDVLGAIIEVVSGMSFGEYMRKNVWSPLGISLDTTFSPNDEQMRRMVPQYNYENGDFKLVSKDCPYRLTNNYESGGAGIASKVDDYILFADALACGGIGANGNRILNSDTIELMRTPQLSAICFEDFKTKCANKPGYSYAFGVRTLVDKKSGDSLSPIGEFGWDGAAGTYVMIDPINRISIFYAQHVRAHSPCYDVIHPAVRNAAYLILGIE